MFPLQAIEWHYFLHFFCELEESVSLPVLTEISSLRHTHTHEQKKEKVASTANGLAKDGWWDCRSKKGVRGITNVVVAKKGAPIWESLASYLSSAAVSFSRCPSPCVSSNVTTPPPPIFASSSLSRSGPGEGVSV